MGMRGRLGGRGAGRHQREASREKWLYFPYPPDLCVSLVTHSASYFAGSASCAFTLYDLHCLPGGREFPPEVPFPGMLHSPSSFKVSKPSLAGISRCVQENSSTPGRLNLRTHF